MHYIASFLVADTQLYKRLCPSVRPLVRWSVGPSVRRRSSSWKVWKWAFSIFFFVCLSVGGGFGCGWGLDAPAHPSATILWPRVTCSIWTMMFSFGDCFSLYEWTKVRSFIILIDIEWNMWFVFFSFFFVFCFVLLNLKPTWAHQQDNNWWAVLTFYANQ